jgi:hypothetical protein
MQQDFLQCLCIWRDCDIVKALVNHADYCELLRNVQRVRALSMTVYEFVG